MASIRKLKNGSYQAQIFAGRDLNGKQIRKWITASTLKECKTKIREIEYEIENKTFVNVENIRLCDYMDRWYDLQTSRLSPTTTRVYKIYIEKYYKPKLGHYRLAQINEMHIKEFYHELLKDKKSKTVLKIHCVLNAALEEVLKNKNPCREVKAPKKERYIPTILDEDEFNKLRNGIKGTEAELPILLAAWLGLRLGEIFGLRWKDIDLKTGLIRIRQTQVKAGPGNYVLKSPKSDSGKRDLIAPKYILSMLKKHKKSQKVLRDLIFDQKPDNFSRRFEYILKHLELPKTRFHDLRHYHATMMLKHGIPDLYASKRLGHASVSTTKEIYQHITSDMESLVEHKLKELFG